MIRTERLVLRPFAAEDADFVHDLFSRDEVARWIGDGSLMASREEAVERIALYPDRAGTRPGTGIFAVVPHDGATAVGMVLLVPLPSSAGVESEGIEIGWHFHPDTWGQGYATEAAAAVIDHGFACGIAEIHAVTDPANVRSQAVCRRLGMTDLGLRTDWYDKELRAFRLDRP